MPIKFVIDAIIFSVIAIYVISLIPSKKKK